MDKLLIEGGRKLEGTIRISGAKNAALPAMAAALLTSERVELDNIPRVRDIITMGKLLAHMTATVEMPEVPPTAMTIQAKTVNGAEAPYELVRTMRASILTLGPLVARNGSARVSLPGGCSIGARPVDLHLKALEQMGAEIGTSHGYVEARVPGNGRLPGGRVFFDKITVTGTENILMAAVLAAGETRIENAAREPEITDLAELLIKMGAENRRRGNVHNSGAGAKRTARREAHDYPGPHRSRNVPGRRCDHQWLARNHPLRARALDVGHRQTARNRRRNQRNRSRHTMRSRRKKAGRSRHHHRGISRIRHRHAGAVHGAGNTGRRQFGDHRNDLRKSLSSRQ